MYFFFYLKILLVILLELVRDYP